MSLGMGRNVRNAIIESADIDTERCLTYWVHLKYEGAGQGFGGYVLGGDFGCEAIKRLLSTVGVGSWKKLEGSPVRVDADFGRVYRIGHFLEEKWLDLEALAKELAR